MSISLTQADKLIQLRSNNNLSLKDVSSATGLSISLISKLENGRISLSPKSAQILSCFYNIDLVPSRIIMSYEYHSPLKETHYKMLNKNLKEENDILKKENKKLKDIIKKIKDDIILLD